MRDVVSEEDRSKNMVIFGLVDENGEEITEKVSQLFQILGEKPNLEAHRIGLKSKKNPRPVKVSVSDSNIVLQILRITKNFQDSDQYISRYSLVPTGHRSSAQSTVNLLSSSN